MGRVWSGTMLCPHLLFKERIQIRDQNLNRPEPIRLDPELVLTSPIGSGSGSMIDWVFDPRVFKKKLMKENRDLVMREREEGDNLISD